MRDVQSDRAYPCSAANSRKLSERLTFIVRRLNTLYEETTVRGRGDSWVLRSPELTHATTKEQIVTDHKYAAFTALDPFFDIVQQGLGGLVDGDRRRGVRISISFPRMAPDP